jgi:Domain of unknown function (DUF4352)
VLAAAGCSGSSSPPATGTASVRTASTLPASGTVKLPDGRIYTVAAPGQPLRLDDVEVDLRRVKWSKSVKVAVAPPGTSEYAIVKASVTNRSKVTRKITLTQFWLLDPSRHEYLAAPGSNVPRDLVGRLINPGQTVRGTLVYPTAGRFSTGTLLVYRFADSAAIAKARHVGLARFQC